MSLMGVLTASGAFSGLLSTQVLPFPHLSPPPSLPYSFSFPTTLTLQRMIMLTATAAFLSLPFHSSRPHPLHPTPCAKVAPPSPLSSDLVI